MAEPRPPLWEEYGDATTVMGGQGAAPTPAEGFNGVERHLLGWIPTSVRAYDVSAQVAHDHATELAPFTQAPSAAFSLLSLRFPSEATAA